MMLRNGVYVDLDKVVFAERKTAEGDTPDITAVKEALACGEGLVRLELHMVNTYCLTLSGIDAKAVWEELERRSVTR